jgi:enoyl-CoA hydratase/carnithine racemase
LSDRIELAISNGIAEVRLNRPDKLNALDVEMFEALAAAGSELQQAPGLRAVVLCGNGPSFSVGIDLATLSSASDSPVASLASRTHGDANLFQWCALQWRALPVPVIVALHGHVLGGGLQLALGADIRIVAPAARLSIREMVWGLIPDMAGMILLPSLLRDDVLRDLVFTGRTVSGEEAVALGLATRMAENPLVAARILATELADRSPDAIRAAKRLINANATGTTTPANLLAEANEQQRLLASANHREALAAHAEQRPPRFRD